MSYLGFAPKTPTPSLPAISRIAFSERTLLPASFKRGENAAIANRPGTTATMPPPTPVFAGKPGRVHPLARLVVEARRGHDREQLGDVLGRQHAPVRHGVHAAVRERRAHHAEVLRADADGALARVDAHALLRDRCRGGRS